MVEQAMANARGNIEGLRKKEEAFLSKVSIQVLKMILKKEDARSRVRTRVLKKIFDKRPHPLGRFLAIRHREIRVDIYARALSHLEPETKDLSWAIIELNSAIITLKRELIPELPNGNYREKLADSRRILEGLVKSLEEHIEVE